jgi:hypothetical protein
MAQENHVRHANRSWRLRGAYLSGMTGRNIIVNMGLNCNFSAGDVVTMSALIAN